VLEVQGGFKWPHFILSSVILSEVGLHHEDKQLKFRLYNTAVCTWTTVQISHIITLQDGDHIFLKQADVTRCLKFDALLSGSEERKPHFVKDLPCDRTYIRQALKAKTRQSEKMEEILSSDEDEVEVVEDVEKNRGKNRLSSRAL
jgi:hypothetical protein